MSDKEDYIIEKNGVKYKEVDLSIVLKEDDNFCNYCDFEKDHCCNGDCAFGEGWFDDHPLHEKTNVFKRM